MTPTSCSSVISFLRWYPAACTCFVLGWLHLDLKTLISPQIGFAHGAGQKPVWLQDQADLADHPCTGPPCAHQGDLVLCRSEVSEGLPSMEAAKPQTKRLTWWILTRGLRVRMRQAVILLFLAAGVCLYLNTLYACYPANLASCQKLPGNGFPAGLISSNCDAPVILPASFLTINWSNTDLGTTMYKPQSRARQDEPILRFMWWCWRSRGDGPTWRGSRPVRCSLAMGTIPLWVLGHGVTQREVAPGSTAGLLPWRPWHRRSSCCSPPGFQKAESGQERSPS